MAFFGTAIFMIGVGLAAQPPFALHEGDRVLFYGDSITDQRLYTSYVETFVVTRFPNLTIDFRACGVGEIQLGVAGREIPRFA